MNLSFDILLELNKLKEQFYLDKIDENAYVTNSYSLLHKSLKELLKSDWLAVAFCYINPEKRFEAFTPKLNDDLTSEMHKNFSDYFSYSEKIIKEGSAISITSKLLLSESNRVLLYKGDIAENWKEDEHLIKLDFEKFYKTNEKPAASLPAEAKNNDINKEELISKEFKIFSKKIGIKKRDSEFQRLIKLISAHKDYSENFDTYYEYYIRPLVPHKEYDGIVILFTTKFLTNTQFSVLSLLLTFILSESGFKKLNRKMEKMYSQKHGTRLVHNLNAGISTSFASFKNFSENNDLKKLNNFNYFTRGLNSLQQVQKRADNILLIDKKSTGKIKKNLVNFSYEKFMDLLSESIFYLSKYQHLNRKKRTLLKTIFSTQSFQNWVEWNPSILTFKIEESFDIGLIELLNNCICHSNLEEGPVIKADFDDKITNNIKFEIINQSPMPKANIEYNNTYPNTPLAINPSLGYGTNLILESFKISGVEYSVSVQEGNTHSLLKYQLPLS